MPENNDFEYLARNGIDNGRIAQRFGSVLRCLGAFISAKKINSSIRINFDLLKTAIIDYFVDIARVKEYHNIERVNPEKIYGYMAYWLLRRKPIQVTGAFINNEFINEQFITWFLVSNILSELGISSGPLNEFQSLLYYNMKYRQVTQQSLELMIKAFFSGYKSKI
jgi:hypothetical protein